ncbi:MAG: TonB-dependent receptor [Rhodocyclales bacterium]|nr:TonB-dependent receptor [Rhodocyclales bacterium]
MGFHLRPLTAAIAIAFCQAAWAQNTLNEVTVSAERIPDLGAPRALKEAEISAKNAVTRDTAALLQDVPGVSLYGAGGISSLPAIHGLADDRLRISVDGMDFIATCPNHMNPPLSYLDPAAIGEIKVYAGITPVSVGGDSIGGSIVAETKAPQFAKPGEGLLSKGEIGAFARSNNNAIGGNASATLANENFSVSYSGAYSRADNYKAGGAFKSSAAQNQTFRPGHEIRADEVGSTAYESWTHLLGLAYRNENHLIEGKIGYQDVPKQLYPNQRMDMLGNEQTRLNLRYFGQYDWGTLEARAYHEQVDHFMDFGADKKYWYWSGNPAYSGAACDPNTQPACAAGMPMYSTSKTSGVNLKADIELNQQDLLRVGALYQTYKLNDWWQASGANMAPNNFQNINNGQRDRLGAFAEWEKRLSSQWRGLLGMRYEMVTTDADAVHGYNLATAPYSGVGGVMNQTTDAVAFNNANRSKTDHNIDVTALAHYTIDQQKELELGLARKVRSPSLYERYTWSTANMMTVMNNFVGDGNGYVGNIDLKPEKAYTASATFDLHSVDRRWELKATPYVTYVEDYIDAIRCDAAAMGGCPTTVPNPSTNTFIRLMYTNQTALLYGLDLSGRMPLGKTGLGEFGLKGLVNYSKGENRDTGDNLYNIMPLNGKISLTQQTGGWNNAIEFVAVQGKHDVSAVRNEIQTPGYALTHLRGSYTWQKLRIDFGVENLFDKFYYLPTGGAYLGQGTTMSINNTSIPWGVAVPGMGRAFYAGLNWKF